MSDINLLKEEARADRLGPFKGSRHRQKLCHPAPELNLMIHSSYFHEAQQPSIMSTISCINDCGKHYQARTFGARSCLEIGKFRRREIFKMCLGI